MKRSEAMDKLRELSRHDDTSQYFPLLRAVRDLLNAEEDAIADLPWRVIDDVDGSTAAFELEHDARAYASELLGGGCTITGPTQPVCDDEDEPTESKYDPAFEGDPDDCAFKHTPRLVPVTEQIVVVDGKYYRVEP